MDTHMQNKDIRDVEVMQENLKEKNIISLLMKVPDFVMNRMSTYGDNNVFAIPTHACYIIRMCIYTYA